MPTSRGTQADDGRGLCSLVTLSLLLRLPLLFTMLRDPEAARQADDYIKFGSVWIATGWYEGEWFPPLYPLICGGIAKLTGQTAIQTILILQFIAGLYSIIFTHKIARAIGLPVTPALAAAAVMALDPANIQYGSLVLSETLFTFLTLLAATILLSRDGKQLTGSSGQAALAGIIFGLALLTRSIGIVLIPIAISVFLVDGAFLKMCIFLMSAFCAVSPWIKRNHEIHGHYALSASGAYNFAALLVAPAKAAVDGTDRTTALRSWENQVPALVKRDPFEYGSAVSKLAKQWAVDHKPQMAAATARGLVNLFFGSDWSAIGPVLFKSLWKPIRPMFLGFILVWRILTLGGAVLALPLAFLRRERGLVVIACWVAIIILAVPVGAGGYSRFLVPIIPFISLALGLAVELKAARRIPQ